MKYKKYITEDDLENIAHGATLLGSGGGGDPECDLLRTAELIRRLGPIPVIEVEELNDDDLVVPIAFMGAPLVCIEKLMSGKETAAILEQIELFYGRKPSALVACEIGGSNAFSALQAAICAGLPVIDGDTLGRAFPQLEMSACTLFGISPTPAFIADSQGNVAQLKAESAKDVERLFRPLCTAMGSSAAVALYIMNGKEAKKALIRGTLSICEQLGAMLKKGSNDFKVIASGVISDIEQEIQEGFLRGKIMISSGTQYTIDYQNEYLVLFEGQHAVVTTPDIIALVDTETGMPLSIEQVKFGLSVHILAIPCPPIWKTEKGLAMVGPEAFGYNISYNEVVV